MTDTLKKALKISKLDRSQAVLFNCTIVIVFKCASLQEIGVAMSEVTSPIPIPWVGDDEALVYTMRDLNQQTARIMSDIETTGKTAFITRHGRFIAIITPLAPGQVESRVLTEMAREIGKQVRG
jgi:antitoxin (DNA-binding transcriptional repressor) of toxin-antitoxin stability system